MSKKKSVLMGSALAGLLLGSVSCSMMESSTAATGDVMCYGVNSCKGHGTCAGKVDSCNGKNGCESVMKCAGMNSCKGKGLIKMSEKDCKAKKGKAAS